MNEYPMEMKPCPFCGKPGMILHSVGDGYLPMCSDNENCMGMVECWFEEEDDAIEAWNRRVEK